MIVPTADRSKATVMVKVRFIDKDPRLLPEMSAKVAFLSKPASAEDEKPHIAVNSAALIDRKGEKFVFLIRGERVAETPVRSGEKFGDMTEITEGLKTGDRVILRPLSKLKNGSRIKIAEQ